MKIGKNWKIESDSMNITLFKRHTVKATPTKPAHNSWSAEGYYSKIQHALKGLVDFEVKETELKDLKTVVEKQDELYKLIKGIRDENGVKK